MFDSVLLLKDRTLNSVTVEMISLSITMVSQYSEYVIIGC